MIAVDFMKLKVEAFHVCSRDQNKRRVEEIMDKEDAQVDTQFAGALNSWEDSLWMATREQKRTENVKIETKNLEIIDNFEVSEEPDTMKVKQIK